MRKKSHLELVTLLSVGAHYPTDMDVLKACTSFLFFIFINRSNWPGFRKKKKSYGINFKRFFMNSKVATAFWEKAGRLNDNNMLTDMNCTQKLGVSYSH